jgi:hypothetical protein
MPSDLLLTVCAVSVVRTACWAVVHSPLVRTNRCGVGSSTLMHPSEGAGGLGRNNKGPLPGMSQWMYHHAMLCA